MNVLELLWQIVLAADFTILAFCGLFLLHCARMLLRKRRDRRPATPVDLARNAYMVFTRKEAVR